MIFIIDTEDLRTDNLFPYLREKNVVIIHPDLVEKVTLLIKQWIAGKIANEYGGDAGLMAQDTKFFFRYVTNSLVGKEKFILTTNDESK